MDIYLDIETIPGPTRLDPASIAAPANYKDPEKIRAYQEAAALEEWKKQALHPLRGRLWILGFAVEDGPVKVLVGEDDGKDSLPRLDSIAHQALPGIVTWIGHNLVEFDLPWIQVRAIKFHMPALARAINLDRYHGNHFDTMQRLGAWSSKWSLDEACLYFGVGLPFGSGADVFQQWREGDIEAAAQHCQNDVERVRRLHRLIRNFV